MNIQLGMNYLITTDNWFYGIDGKQYRAAWGKVHEILDADGTLGLKTNRNSTNWYVSIGCMVIAGCQIHYVVQTDKEPDSRVFVQIEHEGKLNSVFTDSPVFNANKE